MRVINPWNERQFKAALRKIGEDKGREVDLHAPTCEAVKIGDEFACTCNPLFGVKNG